MTPRASSSSPLLVKEVAPPEGGGRGVGALLVASLAMLFALAGAALVLRAQMAAGPACPYVDMREGGSAAGAPAPVVERAPERREAPCGEATYRHNGDGSVSVTYELCRASGGPASELRGIEIRGVTPR